MTAAQSHNVSDEEVAKFEQMAAQWWDPEGQFKPLHRMNPIRANFIDQCSPVAEKQVLDVGCGGGLLSEALAQRGARVTGIDMSDAALTVARLHAQENQLDIQYHQTTAETYAEQNANQFDVITCLEMLEHVPSPLSVVAACSKLVKPGGDVFFSTLNRNPKSYLLSIIAAEYILKWLPKGTHEYTRFIKPSELASWGRAQGLVLKQLKGLVYNPLTGAFRISERDVDCNYIAHFQRKPDK